MSQPSWSRREFVQSTAAAALTAPMIVPSSVLGKDPAKPAPSQRINLGFIGVGKQASGHVNGFAGMPSVNIVAVCDVHTGRRERAQNLVNDKYKKLERQDYKGCDAYVDYRELLARKDIDAVCIGTPDHWHTTILVEAARAKKHIYCEKPLTLTIAEAELAIKAVRKYKVVFQTGSQQRSTGPFREVCEYIRSGRLGSIKEVHVGVQSTSKPCDLPENPTPEGLDWDRWQGQAPARGWNSTLCSNEGEWGKYPFNPGWRDYREYSGGYVTDWGAHHFDITQWALDKDTSGPDEIHAPETPPEKPGETFGARLVYHKTAVGDNVQVIHTKMENGIRFIGEKGEIFVSRQKKISNPESILAEPLTDKDVKLRRSPGHKEDWLKCITTGERPICDVEIGARSVTVCHLVNLAYWHNRSFKWDPKKWEFIGDAEANKLKSRPQRQGYELPSI